MKKVDDAVARFEARIGADLVLEEQERREVRRRIRMFAFTRIDLMRAVLSEAANRTAVALGIPPELCRAALVPDPVSKKYRPAIEIDKRMNVDEEAVRKIFGFAFRRVHDEWGHDLAYAAADAHATPTLAAAIPLKESEPAFGQRVKAWLQPASVG